MTDPSYTPLFHILLNLRTQSFGQRNLGNGFAML
jgi:hypothetical protein